jgi:ribonuclease D
LPESLALLLENPDIIKVGVALHDDLKALNNLREFSPAGFLELQTFVKKFNILDNGLRRLAGNILNVKISKSQQLSNWEAPQLSEAQVSYAATDAWACYEIYIKLLEYERTQH